MNLILTKKHQCTKTITREQLWKKLRYFGLSLKAIVFEGDSELLEHTSTQQKPFMITSHHNWVKNVQRKGFFRSQSKLLSKSCHLLGLTACENPSRKYWAAEKKYLMKQEPDFRKKNCASVSQSNLISPRRVRV